MNSYIKHISFHVPRKNLTNNDLSQMMDTSDEWISTRTGIKQRHIVGDSGEGPTDLAVESTKKLFDKIDVKLDDIDFVFLLLLHLIHMFLVLVLYFNIKWV